MSWEIAVAVVLVGFAGVFAYLAVNINDSRKPTLTANWLKVLFFLLCFFMVVIGFDFSTKMVNVGEQLSANDTFSNATTFNHLRSDTEGGYKMAIYTLILVFFVIFIFMIRDTFNMIRNKQGKLEEDFEQ